MKITVSNKCHRGLAFRSVETVNNDDVLFTGIPAAVSERVFVPYVYHSS